MQDLYKELKELKDIVKFLNNTIKEQNDKLKEYEKSIEKLKNVTSDNSSNDNTKEKAPIVENITVDNAYMLGNMTIKDILNMIDVKLAERYLTTGQYFTTSKIVDKDADSFEIDVIDQVYIFLVTINGIVLPESDYSLNGTKVTINKAVSKNDVVEVRVFKQLELVTTDNYMKILEDLEKNKNYYLNNILSATDNPVFMDAIVKGLDDRIDDFDIVDGKAKIEDDAIVTDNNDKDDEAAWDNLLGNKG